MQRILVTGANGQIGSDLVALLRHRFGNDYVLGLDLSVPAPERRSGPHEILDITDREGLHRIARQFEPDTVFHLASLLSAKGEKMPQATWTVNLDGLRNVLDLAAESNLQVFWPSSIAVFGPNTPKENTPQHTALDPVTMYGITKSAGELLCQYYHRRYGVDIRSVRYPGLISHAAPPGGGTTDYTIDMLRAAVEDRPFSCFVAPDTRLPMMYMPDAIRATLDLMDAPVERISIRTSYNIAAFSFTARELEQEILKTVPGFRCDYEPDYRNDIARTWPSTIDDSAARSDWSWRPEYTLETMVADMLEQFRLALVRD